MKKNAFRIIALILLVLILLGAIAGYGVETFVAKPGPAVGSLEYNLQRLSESTVMQYTIDVLLIPHGPPPDQDTLRPQIAIGDHKLLDVQQGTLMFCEEEGKFIRAGDLCSSADASRRATTDVIVRNNL